MTKTTTILAFSIVLALAVGITASTSMVDAKPPEPGPTEVLVTNDNASPVPVTGIPSSVVCPPENAKIITAYTASPTIEIQHATEPNFSDSATVFVINGADEVVTNRTVDIVDRLNELGYFVNDGTPRPVTTSDISGNSGIGSQNPICMES